MECKAFPTGYVRGTWTYVLIETLWNVKELMNHVLRFSEGCINRNIMECKAGKKQQPVNTKHTY